MYSILSVQTDNIRNIFLTAGKHNSWLFQQHCSYFGGENYFQKSLWKNGKLLECNRNAELLRLVGASFDGFSQKDEEEKFDNSEKLAVLFVCSSVRKIVIFSLNVFMTVLYLKFFAILQQFAFLLSNILISIMAFIAIYAIKVPVWTRYKYFN